MTYSYRILGWSYVAVCGGLVGSTLRPHKAPPAAAPIQVVQSAPRTGPVEMPLPSTSNSDAAGWFQTVKPHCNAVEINVLQRQTPAPANVEGSGYHAACFALAGRIDDARRIIDSLPTEARATAAQIVFDIGHPVADAGDDRSAGPIMELVVRYSPGNYMAVYHAGMAEFAVGQNDLARKNLEEFMRLYSDEDGWRGSARSALARLNEGRTPPLPTDSASTR